MKKVLIVGWPGLDLYEKITEKYTDTLFVKESSINYSGAQAVIELVGMFDMVMFIGSDHSDRIAFEVACAMKNVRVIEKDEFPVDDEPEVGKKENVDEITF